MAWAQNDLPGVESFLASRPAVFHSGFTVTSV
jgi:hypothetical protein